jgi:hypothetical protein
MMPRVVTALARGGAVIIAMTVPPSSHSADPVQQRIVRPEADTRGIIEADRRRPVAAGMCARALGTQTIGSILRPASYCGVVGFKPTIARFTAAASISSR